MLLKSIFFFFLPNPVFHCWVEFHHNARHSPKNLDRQVQSFCEMLSVFCCDVFAIGKPTVPFITKTYTQADLQLRSRRRQEGKRGIKKTDSLIFIFKSCCSEHAGLLFQYYIDKPVIFCPLILIYLEVNTKIKQAEVTVITGHVYSVSSSSSLDVNSMTRSIFFYLFILFFNLDSHHSSNMNQIN